MNEEFYLIKEAAAKVGVESHVLRYWEEELKMDIHRNAKGHRYYTRKDIEVLSKVRDLKDKGLQLKAIRSYLEMRREQMEKIDTQDNVLHIVAQDDNRDELSEENNQPLDKQELAEIVAVKQQLLTNEEKMQQFQEIMNRVLSTAIKENHEMIGESIGKHAADKITDQIQGMTKEQEARAEERYQKLDQTLREIQRARMEAAAANIRPVDRRRQKRLKRKTNQGEENTSQENRTN